MAFSDRLKIESSTIKTIRKSHKQELSGQKKDNPSDDNIIFISEEEALKKLSVLNIPVISLRQYASSQGILKGEGSWKYGRGFKYREDFIEDLAQNWIHAKNLQEKLRLDHSAFYRTLKGEKWRVLKIEKGLYISKKDCI